jgi:hypothetical protein
MKLLFVAFATVAVAIALLLIALNKQYERSRMKAVHEWGKNNIANRRIGIAAEQKFHLLSVSTRVNEPSSSRYPITSKVAKMIRFSGEEERQIAQASRKREYNDMLAKHCSKREGSPFWDPIRQCSMVPPMEPSTHVYVPPEPLRNYQPKILTDCWWPGGYIPPPEESWPPTIRPTAPAPQQAPVAAQRFTPEQLNKAADHLRSFRRAISDKISALTLNKWNPSRILTLCVEMTEIINNILPDARILAQETNNIEGLRNHLDYPLENLIDLLVNHDKDSQPLPEQVVTMSKSIMDLFVLLGGDVNKITVNNIQAPAPVPGPAPAVIQNTAAAAITGKPYSVAIGGHTFTRDPVPTTTEDGTVPKTEAAGGLKKKKRSNDERNEELHGFDKLEALFNEGEKMEKMEKSGRSYRDRRGGGRPEPY